MARRKKKKKMSLDDAAEKFVDNWIKGMCTFIASGPAGESPKETARERKACEELLREDEERVNLLKKRWKKGFQKFAQGLM